MTKYRIGILVVLFVVFAVVAPQEFLTRTNISSMLLQLPELGFLSLAISIVILTGGNNLSNVATAILSGIVGAKTMVYVSTITSNDIIIVCIGMLVGCFSAIICGIINGSLDTFIKVPSMLATLVTGTFFSGISMLITRGKAVSGFSPSIYMLSRQNILGIPLWFFVFVVVSIIFCIIMSYSKYGRQLYIVGSNKEVASYAGIDTKKTVFVSYIISAILSFFAGIVMTSRYNSIKVDYGSSYLLQSLTAAVLGGINLSGGEGSFGGVILAVCILQIISNGMNCLNINRLFTDIFTGGMLIIILTVAIIIQKINPKKKKEKKI